MGKEVPVDRLEFAFGHRTAWTFLETTLGVRRLANGVLPA